MAIDDLSLTATPVVPPAPGRDSADRLPDGADAGLPDGQRPDRLDTLIAATLFLMTAHARSGHDPRLAGVVRRHLEALAEHADTPGVLGAVCEQAADHWAGLARSGQEGTGAAARAAPAGRSPGRRPWLRLVGG